MSCNQSQFNKIRFVCYVFHSLERRHISIIPESFSVVLCEIMDKHCRTVKNCSLHKKKNLKIFRGKVQMLSFTVAVPPKPHYPPSLNPAAMPPLIFLHRHECFRRHRFSDTVCAAALSNGY